MWRLTSLTIDKLCLHWDSLGLVLTQNARRHGLGCMSICAWICGKASSIAANLLCFLMLHYWVFIINFKEFWVTFKLLFVQNTRRVLLFSQNVASKLNLRFTEQVLTPNRNFLIIQVRFFFEFYSHFSSKTVSFMSSNIFITSSNCFFIALRDVSKSLTSMTWDR